MCKEFDIASLKREIGSLSDEKYAGFHSRICKTRYKINGVRMGDLRRISNRLITEGYANSVKSIQPSCYEEVMIKALVIAGGRRPFADKVKDIEAFIDEIDNWAVCDALSSEMKPKKKELSEVFGFVKDHIYGKREYEIRLAVVLALNYLITDEYVDGVIGMLSRVDCSYYYTSMAVAWALSFCFIKYQDKTLDFLKKCKLDEKTFSRTVSKIQDSFRVSDSDKKLVKQLR